ncbi:hypothetical protein [Clostridium estertheticum]|uniref:hypothetical protein n=1 Tax=Clostridium estertheticum TaxID=238834 RepID=UPI001C6F5B8A|nr:hypothetical protein [Clostridium estertheticum]MBW9152887.1 hypothetical protein [Clostridium estertheticum]WLC82739.1 hypothetical protein KTC97_11385 [Clostridium estertheticum]
METRNIKGDKIITQRLLSRAEFGYLLKRREEIYMGNDVIYNKVEIIERCF